MSLPLLSLSAPDLLGWASLDETVNEAETRFAGAGLTLGASMIWGGDTSVREWLRTRSAVRYNPVLCRIEEQVAAWAYTDHGQRFETVTTPREACGPELRTLLFAELDRVQAVRLRLLPLGKERWYQMTAESAEDLRRLVRQGLYRGYPYRSLWLHQRLGWIGFVGSCIELEAAAWHDVFSDLNPVSEPVMRTTYRSFRPTKTTWNELLATDQILMADPWRLVVRRV